MVRVGDVTLDAGHVVPDRFQVGGRYLRSPGHNNFKLQENIILFIELISNHTRLPKSFEPCNQLHLRVKQWRDQGSEGRCRILEMPTF